MKVVDLPTESLQEASWNPNQMDEPMLARLRASIERYGVVVPLVVRPTANGAYEVLSGNQRLKVLCSLRLKTVPCIVIEVDDNHARLLAQALNHIRGEDDLGLRAELIHTVLDGIPQDKILAVLPETADSLLAFASLGQDTIAAYLQKWQQAQGAKLKHLQFQLTSAQLVVVERALERLMPQASQARADSPNTRGTALYLLCRSYLEKDNQT